MEFCSPYFWAKKMPDRQIRRKKGKIGLKHPLAPPCLHHYNQGFFTLLSQHDGYFQKCGRITRPLCKVIDKGGNLSISGL